MSVNLFDRLNDSPHSNIDSSIYRLSRFTLFFFFRDTYVEREPGEKVNDRNDRAIRVAAAWYQSHVNADVRKAKNKVEVVLLTDDAANREKAIGEGINATSSKGISVTLTVHFLSIFVSIY